MAAERFDAALTEILLHEGGFVDHPRDPGGATNMGITFAVLREWRGKPITKADVARLTRDEAAAIYRARYWNPITGDQLQPGVDLCIFDMAVNSGVSRASKFTQAVVTVPVDGRIGPVTRLGIATMGKRAFIKALCAKRLGFLKSLAIWSTFKGGWSKRVARVEAKSLAWASTKEELVGDAKEAQTTSNSQAGGAVVGTGGGIAAPNLLTDFPWWFAAGLVAIVVIPLVIRAIIQAQRASALAEAAKGAQP